MAKHKKKVKTGEQEGEENVSEEEMELSEADQDDEDSSDNQENNKYDPKREELKIKKLERRLENLKSLTGKSYKFWAVTIMRFDLGV